MAEIWMEGSSSYTTALYSACPFPEGDPAASVLIGPLYYLCERTFMAEKDRFYLNWEN